MSLTPVLKDNVLILILFLQSEIGFEFLLACSTERDGNTLS